MGNSLQVEFPRKLSRAPSLEFMAFEVETVDRTKKADTHIPETLKPAGKYNVRIGNQVSLPSLGKQEVGSGLIRKESQKDHGIYSPSESLFSNGKSSSDCSLSFDPSTNKKGDDDDNRNKGSKYGTRASIKVDSPHKNKHRPSLEPMIFEVEPITDRMARKLSVIGQSTNLRKKHIVPNTASSSQTSFHAAKIDINPNGDGELEKVSSESSLSQSITSSVKKNLTASPSRISHVSQDRRSSEDSLRCQSLLIEEEEDDSPLEKKLNIGLVKIGLHNSSMQVERPKCYFTKPALEVMPFEVETESDRQAKKAFNDTHGSVELHSRLSSRPHTIKIGNSGMSYPGSNAIIRTTSKSETRHSSITSIGSLNLSPVVASMISAEQPRMSKPPKREHTQDNDFVVEYVQQALSVEKKLDYSLQSLNFQTDDDQFDQEDIKLCRKKPPKLAVTARKVSNDMLDTARMVDGPPVTMDTLLTKSLADLSTKVILGASQPVKIGKGSDRPFSIFSEADKKRQTLIGDSPIRGSSDEIERKPIKHSLKLGTSATEIAPSPKNRSDLEYVDTAICGEGDNTMLSKLAKSLNVLRIPGVAVMSIDKPARIIMKPGAMSEKFEVEYVTQPKPSNNLAAKSAKIKAMHLDAVIFSKSPRKPQEVEEIVTDIPPWYDYTYISPRNFKASDSSELDRKDSIADTILTEFSSLRSQKVSVDSPFENSLPALYKSTDSLIPQKTRKATLDGELRFNSVPFLAIIPKSESDTILNVVSGYSNESAPIATTPKRHSPFSSFGKHDSSSRVNLHDNDKKEAPQITEKHQFNLWKKKSPESSEHIDLELSAKKHTKVEAANKTLTDQLPNHLKMGRGHSSSLSDMWKKKVPIEHSEATEVVISGKKEKISGKRVTQFRAQQEDKKIETPDVRVVSSFIGLKNDVVVPPKVPRI